MTLNPLSNPYKPYMDTAVPTSSQADLNSDKHFDAPIDPTVKPESDAEVTTGNAATSIPAPTPVDFTKNLPTLPTPPFIVVEGVPNFRDLGGYACPPPPSASSSTKPYRVKSQLLHRCATLSQITPNGSSTLTDHLNIKTLYDLRSTQETTRVGAIPEIPNLTRHFTPVYPTEDYSPEVLSKKYAWYTAPPDATYAYTTSTPIGPVRKTVRYSTGFVNAYRDIATAASSSAYRTILQHLLHSPAEPLIFHCTAGKDRTGVLGALLLTLCRVDVDTICWEYSITEPGLGSWREEIVARMTKNGMGTHSAMSRDSALRLCGSANANMRVFLAEVLEREMGGVERYLMDFCGLSQEEVVRLRENLVEEGEGMGVQSIAGWSGNEELVVEKDGQEGRSLGLATNGKEREDRVMVG